MSDLAERCWPRSIREINDLPQADKQAIYRTLIPDWVFPMFGIDARDHTVRGQQAVHMRCPRGSQSVEIAVHADPDMADPTLYLHMGDTFHSQLAVLLVIVNDPTSPRFNVDMDPDGRPNQLGTGSRNIAEEIRAMQAGLVPGQVRRGLRVFRAALPTFEQFVRRMGHDVFFIEPLFYHNAIVFERYGFAYSRGLHKMKTIHQEFAPGGSLHARLDGSTPFRHPEAAQSISGRSWAIQDGVLGEPFTGIQMYKRVGQDAGIQTFPGATWR